MVRPWQKVTVYALLLAYAAVTLVPILYLVAASVKEGEDLDRYTFFPPPSKITLLNFAKLFGSQEFGLKEIRAPAGFCRTVLAAGGDERPSPARRVWERLGEKQRQTFRRITEIREPVRPEPLAIAEDAPGYAAARSAHDDVIAGYRAARAAYEAAWRAQREELRAVLNGVVHRRRFYDEEAFADERTGWEARRLCAGDPASLSGRELARRNRLLLEAAFSGSLAQNETRVPFTRYVLNSLFVASTVVLVQLFFSSLGGFALAKYRFRGKAPLTVVMLGTMMIPMPVLLAPLYEQIFHLGLMDSHAGLIVPGAVSVFGLFLFRQSMLSLPDELLEAARIDGCSEFAIYWRIALPLTRPMIGAFTLIAFMATWNGFLWPQIILHTKELFTLPIGLAQLSGTQEQILGPLMAGTLMAILPVMLLFLFFQREFVSGLTKGAVKG